MNKPRTRRRADKGRYSERVPRIRILLSSSDPDVASIRLARGRRELERLAEELDLELLGSSTYELWLLCDDADEALAMLEQALADLGLEGDATLDIV